MKGFGISAVTTPRGPCFAPAESYWSGGGGYEAIEAFERTGRLTVRRSGRDKGVIGVSSPWRIYRFQFTNVPKSDTE